MNKFCKTVLLLGGTAVAAHFGLKAYRRVNGIVKLSKSLPEFLSNVYGESPQINVNQGLGHITIKVGFSQEILDKHDDIENTIREYIDDFYPEVARCSVEIDVHVSGEEGEDESEQDEACEDEDEKAEEIPEA
ncbi:MAG: hypothetical protein LHW64_04795 [Candidatus Cloacimonetes bacterium]|jgi:hypothetical protein|nr:hypothetical protein [Candidatus Cloacimonadota bacterium]MCB5287100.1 hypothetical protein [Candidatus Cloacimonadota bacterium]MCK9184414.1 hypothetical protein [Candidatus Cloacimonadota bacterium]MCK9584774.1 hypothetical protein [Candidatus Cloacimonadota bacterium]MDY0229421.1 hypothetical protein [Candidatus Cloacimonadaceae bacterium]